MVCPRPSITPFMKPEENVCRILVLSYSTLHTADAVGGWKEAHTDGTPFAHVVFYHYHFDDGDADFLVLLDLLDFVRNKLFFLFTFVTIGSILVPIGQTREVSQHDMYDHVHTLLAVQTFQPRTDKLRRTPTTTISSHVWFVELSRRLVCSVFHSCFSVLKISAATVSMGPHRPGRWWSFSALAGAMTYGEERPSCAVSQIWSNDTTGMLTNIQGL